MKFINLFRLPKPKTFNYISYAAKKEQEEKRKKELLELVEAEKQKIIIESNNQNQMQTQRLEDYERDYETTISGTFNKKQKEKISMNTNQLLIMSVLIGGCVLFWNFGAKGILFAVVGVIWVVFRMRMKK